MLTVQSEEFYKKAIPVARHYGFVPLDQAIAAEVDLLPDPKAAQAKAMALRATHERPRVALEGSLRHLEQGLTRVFSAGLMPRRESLLYFTSATSKAKGGGAVLSLGLHAIGSKHSIAEALVLRTSLSILDELGVRSYTVRINGMGDRDSIARYLREVTVFIKRRFGDLPPALQTLAREDVYQTAIMLANRRDALAYELPRPVEYLTTPSRRHLRDVLEFMESNNTPYELDDLLMGPRECFSHLIYEFSSVRTEGSDVRIARGGRYDELSKTLFKVSTPAVGLVIEFHAPQQPTRDVVGQLLRAHTPRVCLINIGVEARIKSFRVIETFRKARIPIEQCFKYERLSDQLAFAERTQAPYVVIVGQKEALEGVAIIRNALTRAQQTVAIDSLPLLVRDKSRV